MNNGKITKDKDKLTKTKTTNNNSKKPSSKHLMTGAAIFIAAILVISGTNIKSAHADTVNTVTVTLSTGGAPLKFGDTVTATYQIAVQGAGADGEGGCNANTVSPLTMTLAASAGLTPSTQNVVFTGCNEQNQRSVTFTSNYQGISPSSASVTKQSHSDSGPGTYAFNVNFAVPLAASPLTAPVMSNVPNNIVKEATSSQGAVATFSPPTAQDERGSVDVTCTPASGSTFALGENIVECSAENDAGITTRTFTITVEDTTIPTLNLPASQSIEATGPLGAVFEYTAEATDLVDGAVDVDCSPASGSTFPLGATGTTVSCSATDAAGNTAQGSFTITVVDETEPTLILPSIVNAIAESSSGALVTFTKSAEDLVSGSVAVTCTPKDSGDNFPLGTTAVTCIATDAAGNTAEGSFDVKVTFPTWSGILQPVNTDGSSIFKQGSTVPVKFQIPIPGGGFVTDANAKIFIAKVSNSVVGEETEAVTSTPASSGNTFRYDGGQYIYNFGTKSYSAGTYQLRIDIGDGSLNTVLISLKK